MKIHSIFIIFQTLFKPDPTSTSKPARPHEKATCSHQQAQPQLTCLQPLTSAHPSTGPTNTQHRPTAAQPQQPSRQAIFPTQTHKYFFNSE